MRIKPDFQRWKPIAHVFTFSRLEYWVTFRDSPNPRVVARTGSAWTHPLADRLSHPGPPAGGHANKYVARYPPRFRSVPLVGSPAHCGFRDASHRFHGAQALCDRPHARRSPLPQQMRLVLQGFCDCCTFVWRSALFLLTRLDIFLISPPAIAPAAASLRLDISYHRHRD